MPRWYDKAECQLADELENGDLSPEEYRAAMKDLNEELKESGREAAERAYYDATEGW